MSFAAAAGAGLPLSFKKAQAERILPQWRSRRPTRRRCLTFVGHSTKRTSPRRRADDQQDHLTLFAGSIEARDPRRQQLIAAVLDDLTRLSCEPSDPPKKET